MDSDATNAVMRNAYESRVLKDYLDGKGKTVTDMFRECLSDVVSGTMSVAGVPRPSDAAQPTCRGCATRVCVGRAKGRGADESSGGGCAQDVHHVSSFALPALACRRVGIPEAHPRV